MSARRAPDDGGFSWPPTDAELSVIDVVPAATAPDTIRPHRTPASGSKPARFGRADGLLLLAAGMLFGSAVPSLDTAPPTRIGMQVVEATGALPASPTVASVHAAAAPTPARARPAVPSGVSKVTPAAASAPVPSATGTASRVDPRTRQVVAVLQSYGRAWSRMDAQAARAAMPSADVDALTRTFTELREQKLTLSGCRVAGSGGTATASCTATRRYRPRQGDHSTRVERGRWHFRVVRTPQRWVIADVDRG